MSEELKSCPHCQGIAKLVRNSNVFFGQKYHGYPASHCHGYRIECEGECHSMTCWWHEKEQAIKAWQRRAYE